MTRPLGWENILYNEITKSSNTNFEWGINDCVKWSINIARKITDDPLPYGITWSNKKEAIEALKTKSMTNRISEYLGSPKVIAYTNRGDLVLREDPELGEMLGICIGYRCAFLSKKGLTYYFLLECKHSWSIL